MKAAAVEVALEKRGGQAERFLDGAVLEDLLRFEGAVGVVAGDPVTEALGEGVVIERILQITHGAIHHSDGINQAFVVHELGPEEADVPGRGLHVAQLPALEVVAAPDAVSNEPRIWVAGDGLEFGGGFGGETLIGVNVKDPRITERNVAQTPVLVRCPVIEGTLNDARTRGGCDVLGAIGAARVVDNYIRAPSNRFQTTRQVLLLVFREDKNGHIHLEPPSSPEDGTSSNITSFESSSSSLQSESSALKAGLSRNLLPRPRCSTVSSLML